MAAGSVLWMVGALAVSSAVGVGVYVAIKQARTARAADGAAEVRPAPPPESDSDPSAVPRPLDRTDPVPVVPTEVTETPPEDPAAGTPPAPGETLGTPGIAGGLDVAAATATLREALPKLQQCDVVLGGRVTVTLEVNRRGGVTSTTVDARDELVGACAARVLQQVRFPRTSDGKTATVVVPLAFERGAAPCDEVSCVLDNYAGACCEKYRRDRRGAETASQPESPTREEIVNTLRPARRAVSSCAVAANFEGTLKVKLTIAPEGTVSRVSVDDVEPALVACVARVIKQHRFSKTRSGVTVSFPFAVPL